MTLKLLASKTKNSFNCLSAFSKIGLVPYRRYKVGVDFVNDDRYALRPTKYSAFDVLETMLSPRGTDLGVGVLVARNPQCISRNIEDIVPSTEYMTQLSMVKKSKIKKPTLASDGGVVFRAVDADDSSFVDPNINDLGANDGSDEIIENKHNDLVESSSNVMSDEFRIQHYTSIKEIIEAMCKEPADNNDPKSNPFRMPHHTTFLFVKSKILFPNEWYIPTLFVSKYMNIHEAANSIKLKVLNLSDDIATIASPFPSVSVTENIPKDHPLYEKLKKRISIFIYRAIYHGHVDEIKFNTDIIQDAQWLTASEAKSVLRPSFYDKLSIIF